MLTIPSATVAKENAAANARLRVKRVVERAASAAAMGNPERRKAKALVKNAREGAIRRGHLGIYKKLQKELHAARERLAGREDLLQFDEIRRALDAKIEELTAVLQDPSVADHVAICEGVYKLLRACQPLYLALNDGLSVKEACDALDAAGAVLDDFADQDAAYKKYRKLNGGWVSDHGKRVKLNAKDFAKWQAKKKRQDKDLEQNPYQHTAQTTEKHIDAVFDRQKEVKRRGDRVKRRTKKARVEEEEPTPSMLRMRVTAGDTKKYIVNPPLFKWAPAGTKNRYRTKDEAMELAAKCVANRPAGMGREAKQAAHAQKGCPRGVTPDGSGYRAQLTPKKRVRVTLAAPGGGCIFASAKAAGEAVKNYEKAGSPTKKSDPLYDTLVHHVQRCK